MIRFGMFVLHLMVIAGFNYSAIAANRKVRGTKK